jgi:alanine racemase
LRFDNTYVNIDLDRIAQNFDAVQQKAGTSVMAVIKADAYGHGAIQVARLLQDKCRFFGVSSMLEARELRQAGLETPILILGHTPKAYFPRAVAENIRPTIFHYEDALALSQEAVAQGKIAPFHFAIDTGMSRIGFQATEESAELCVKIANLPGLFAEGIFSHFAGADCKDLSKAQLQAEKFDAFVELLRQKGLSIPIRHMDNSAGIANFDKHYELVRAGIVLYGMFPSEHVETRRLPIQPALQWRSRVTHVKLLEAGREISYGGTFVTTKPTMVATVPAGYADGYSRNLSGKFHVLIHGKKAPILGRICMDQMMVDVTDIPGVQPEDPVVLVGRDGNNEITMEEISAAADSFNYEFMCGISRRVPRYYCSQGQIVRSVYYLLAEE